MAIRLSLAAKIGGGFCLMMLGALALGGTGIAALAFLQHAQADNRGIVEVRRTMYDARLAATRFLINYDAAEADACRTQLAAVRKLAHELIDDLEPSEAASLKLVAEHLDTYESRLGGIQEAVAKARAQAGNAAPDMAAVDALVKTWRAGGVELVSQLGTTTAAVAARMDSVSRLSMTTMVVLVAISTAVGALLAWRLTVAITRPVAVVRGTLTAMATGDLTRRTAVSSRDEVGEMAADLDRTSAGLRTMIASISQSAHGIAGAADGLNAVSGTLTASASTVSAQSGSVSASATEVSQNINTFAAGVEEMNASVSEIAQNASQAAGVAQEGVAAAARAQAAMTRLETSSAEIGSIVQMINAIAAKTNLLALNATIEAARAGAAGSGFAVVAGEVKQLARQTASATGDIHKRVDGIQTDTREATAAIRQLSEIADRVSGLQQSIASAVEEQSATTRELSGNIAQVSQGGADIARTIVTVADAARSAEQGAQETLASAKELARLAADMQQVVGRFTIA